MQDHDVLGARGLLGCSESGTGLAVLISSLCSALRVSCGEMMCCGHGGKAAPGREH